MTLLILLNDTIVERYKSFTGSFVRNLISIHHVLPLKFQLSTTNYKQRSFGYPIALLITHGTIFGNSLTYLIKDAKTVKPGDFVSGLILAKSPILAGF